MADCAVSARSRVRPARYPERAEPVARVLAIAQLCDELATIKTASR